MANIDDLNNDHQTPTDSKLAKTVLVVNKYVRVTTGAVRIAATIKNTVRKVRKNTKKQVADVTRSKR